MNFCTHIHASIDLAGYVRHKQTKVFTAKGTNRKFLKSNYQKCLTSVKNSEYNGHSMPMFCTTYKYIYPSCMCSYFFFHSEKRQRNPQKMSLS